MTSIPLSLSSLTALAVPALILTGAALAQASDQAPDRPKLRQPMPSIVQQREDVQTSADKSRTEADRKMREMDRRLNRTLRSVCSGC